jgi:2'-5' RNA ligase
MDACMSETIGVLSILEGALLDEALRLWKFFEQDYHSTGVQSFDYPNVSFQGGHCQQVAAVQAALSSLSCRLSPFEVVVDGWSTFEPSNVIYLKVVPTAELERIHQLVNDLLQLHCHGLFDTYHPRRWQPHITLAMQDLTDAGFEHAKRTLRHYHPRYRQTLANLHLVQRRQDTGRIETVHSYALGR